jgi:predicted nucleotidyltransferase
MSNVERVNADGKLLARLTSALEGRKEILEAYLFGSHARGQAQPHSDIDVAVYIDEALADDGAWGYQAQLTTDLMVVLGTNHVDVVVLNRASILLYHRVLRDGVRFLSRDLRATTTRAGQALSRYFDFLPQLDKMDRARRHAAGTANEDRR